MEWQEYLSNSGYKADNQARKDFGENIMLAFKQKNISEGIQWYQALYLHSRIREWKVTYPPALGGSVIYVDLINMLTVSGDIETTCLAIMYGEPDDMTQVYHWCSAERLNWLRDQLKIWLSWS
jgi:hypothetical protein